MTKTTHNGWTNYETWVVALWLDNENEYWREIAREMLNAAHKGSQVESGIWTVEQAVRFNLADRIRDEVTESSPLAYASSIYHDLLSAALSDVNWEEIATNWLQSLD